MKEPVTRRRLFFCETCHIKEPFTAGQFQAHMASAHGLSGKLMGKQELIQAVDGQGFYENTYRWTFPGKVKVTEFSAGPK